MPVPADFEAALAQLPPFPRERAPIQCLCVRPGPDGRELRETIEFCPIEGARGDRWIRKTWMYLPDGRPDPRVQVAIGNSGIIAMIQRLTGNDRHPGDTILTTLDLSMDNLPVGTRLRAGTAILEVSEVENDACAKFAERHGPDVFRWIRDPANRTRRLRGLFASIVQGGIVRSTDEISVLR